MYFSQQQPSLCTVQAFKTSKVERIHLNFLDKFHLKRTYSSMHQENLFHLVSKDISLATILPNIVSHNNYYIENGSVKSIPFSGINLFFSFYTFYSKVSTEATDLVLTLLKQYFSRLQE